MTAPTHGIFAGILLFAFGMPVEAAPYLIFGSLLPDIDHDRSFIGRILFPVSYPLNRKFGHRNITHSLLVWIPLLVIGIKYKIAMWIAIGGLSHLFLDMWNLTGVGIFKPLTDKIFVMANKNFRIKVGSKNEFILMLVFSMMLWGTWELHKKKGLRGVTREVIGAYEMSYDDYERNGLEISYIEGKFRQKEGIIKEEAKYLIIGEGESEGYLVLYDKENDKVIEIPKEGKFLKSKVSSEKKEWSTMKVSDVMEVKSIDGMAFQKATKKWRKLTKGDYVIGTINYLGSIELTGSD